MTGPEYSAAQAVAAVVEGHFARHLAAARQHGQHELAAGPDASAIKAITDAAFWASLRREEGHTPRISLAFLPPEQARRPLMFEQQLPLAPGVLTRLGPAVEGPGIHLGVWRDGDELRVWGTTRSLPRFCFVLQVVEPGLLVIKYRRGENFGKFGNVAVLEADQVKLVDEQSANLPDCPALLAALLGFDSPRSWGESVNVLVQLGVAMRAHKHGGSLLVVPHGTEQWRESIVHPVAYPVAPPFTELAELMREDPVERSELPWQETFRRVVDRIAGLTAVDGATLITDQHELLGFGAKIGRPAASVPVEQVAVTEPIVGGLAEIVHPTQIGGTRHLSAAQFVHDQREALALVASQDGRFTVFAWSPCENLVHAHRVEALML